MALVTRLRLATFPISFVLCASCSPDFEATAESEASGGATLVTSAGGSSVRSTHATEATSNGGAAHTTEATSNGGTTNAGGSKGTDASTAVTSRVWFDSSSAIRVETWWSYYTWGGNPGTGSSGSSCWAISRADMSAAQLSSLEELTLIAGGTDMAECTVDGYHYNQLTVIDSSGTTSKYLDTTCSTFNTGGAKTKVPSSFFNSDSLSLATMPYCTQ